MRILGAFPEAVAPRADGEEGMKSREHGGLRPCSLGTPGEQGGGPGPARGLSPRRASVCPGNRVPMPAGLPTSLRAFHILLKSRKQQAQWEMTTFVAWWAGGRPEVLVAGPALYPHGEAGPTREPPAPASCKVRKGLGIGILTKGPWWLSGCCCRLL